MYSAEKYLDSKRLGVFKDDFNENTLIFATGEKVFARADFVNNTWYVWFYEKHLQKKFCKFKEALLDINNSFLEKTTL